MPFSLSDVLGYTSIACWLGAQFPQLIVNWRLKSADGLALPFLVNWLFGDMTNLVGCILTHQLPFQTYLASYFCFVDVMLLSQYAYYTPFSRYFLPPPTKLPTTPGYGYAPLARSPNVSLVRGRSKSVSVEIERGLRRLSLLREQGEMELEAERRGAEMHERVVSAGGHVGERSTSKQRSSNIGVRKAGMVFLAVGGLFGIGHLSVSDVSGVTSVGHVIGEVDITLSPLGSLPSYVVDLPTVSLPSELERLTSKPDGPDTERVIGRIFAWICTTLYLTSRLPQIWKNFVRKSVEGLSMSLFISAFLGNFFYVLSIITSPPASGPGGRAFLLESIPYLLGSGGVLIFDMIIVLQGRMYRDRSPIDLDGTIIYPEEEDRRGRSRGRRTPVGEGDGLLQSDEGRDGYETVPPSPPRDRD